MLSNLLKYLLHRCLNVQKINVKTDGLKRLVDVLRRGRSPMLVTRNVFRSKAFVRQMYWWKLEKRDNVQVLTCDRLETSIDF